MKLKQHLKEFWWGYTYLLLIILFMVVMIGLTYEGWGIGGI